MPSSPSHYTSLINEAFREKSFGNQPEALYEPIRYILALGGKRLRPVLTLLAYTLFRSEDTVEEALPPALAVEVFHNFTLMHDDIMDQAPLRRGQPTVHRKWNANVAILSGDVMMVKAYDLLMQVPDHKLRPVLEAFNRCATEVCEGQQWDMLYEVSANVSEKEYLAMIRQKTAVLLGFSAQLGSILAGASAGSCQRLFEFGENIGIGFQLKDDLLDVYAEPGKFGKQVGGDIMVNKKTFLLIKALEKAGGPVKEQLLDWLRVEESDQAGCRPQEKVQAVKAIYDQLGIRALTEAKMDEYFEAGFASLRQLEAPEERKQILRTFTGQLINREK